MKFLLTHSFIYYKNGKVKTAAGEIEIIYPDFDDLEWEDAKC